MDGRESTTRTGGEADDLEKSSLPPFAHCRAEVLRLTGAVRELSDSVHLLQVGPLAGREWYEQLTRKLLPQLAEDPFLVVAVVGGTNIGKSVVFNHIAGDRASATSPLASGTKHPVCLVPPGFAEKHDLSRIFQGFVLSPWTDPQAALVATDEHRLFWRVSDQLPANLLVLDTPDIDSDAPVNWLRADYIRHCADVLLAVLTQQKYNDAAVKKFFRNAAAEDKAVIVLFNQCLLPEDETYWPMWLKTFSEETGVKPDLVYVAPQDRRAAERNELTFSLRPWDGETASVTVDSTQFDPATPRHLGRDLAELHFSAIKLRTLRGSLQHLLARQTGLPGYLEEIRHRSQAFQAAARLLSTQQLARIDNWPSPPTPLLVREIRQWWRNQRQGFTRTIHDLYGQVGNQLLRPFRWVATKVVGEEPDPLDVYRQREWDVILQATETLYAELSRLSQLGNELLKPRLEALINGASRVQLLERLAQTHREWDLDEELHQVVAFQMQSFQTDSPQFFQLLKHLDSLAAVARPMTSVVLFFAAGGPVGNAIVPMVTDAATHSLIVHIAGDIAGGTGAVVAGEAALSSTAGGLRHLEAKFRQLQTAFTARRVAWFAEFLRSHLLGQLQQELQMAAELPSSAPFVQVQSILQTLERLISQQDPVKE